MKHFLPIIFVCYFFIFNSCKKYKPAPDAFFIQSSNISVTTTSSVQGSGSHKITDLYLYVDGKFQGAYQNGNTMPIVTKGQNVSVDVFAGIKNNGIKNASITWLFYDKIHFDTLVANGTTIQRPFTFKYAPGVKFAWVEGFDGMGYSLVRKPGSDPQYSYFADATTGNNFEGKSVEIGVSNVGAGATDLEIFESSIYYNLPAGNSNVYLELNYKCNTAFEVGVTGDGLQYKPAMTVNTQENWNKIYIQLADAVNQAPTADKHKVYFKILKQPNGIDNPRVWVDNIKLIYL